MNALTRDLIKLVDMTEEMMKEKGQKEERIIVRSCI